MEIDADYCSLEIRNFIKDTEPYKIYHANNITVYAYRLPGGGNPAKEASSIYSWLCNLLGLDDEEEEEGNIKEVIIWLTPFEKEWDGMEPIGPAQINSGVYDYAKKTIHIWRAQEWRYVLIHEYLHALGFDHGLSGPLAEAWVTFAALFFYCVYVSEGSDSLTQCWARQYAHTELLARRLLSLDKKIRGPTQWYVLMAFQAMPRSTTAAYHSIMTQNRDRLRKPSKRIRSMDLLHEDYPLSLRFVKT